MVITRKTEIKKTLTSCFESSEGKDIYELVTSFDPLILQHRVKFPLLEYCAEQLFDFIPPTLHLEFCREIAFLNREGGNVIIGKILQLRLADHFKESLNEAVYHIERGKEWYVSDIIGERVFGVGLLMRPDICIPFLKTLTNHPSNWVVRSIGSGTHYALKKGLPYNHAQEMFEVLLSLSNTKDYQIKRGIGWAAKTTAKFHPEIIYDLDEKLESDASIGQWFKTKIKIGLARHEYAKL